jgi:hypothetical protein
MPRGAGKPMRRKNEAKKIAPALFWYVREDAAGERGKIL